MACNGTSLEGCACFSQGSHKRDKCLMPLTVIFMTCYVGLTALAGGASSE